MPTYSFGSSGRAIPPIGQGTWNIERSDRREAVTALRRGLDLGLSHIDTAEMYGSGRSEEIVGEAIAGRRDAVFLVSKVLPHNASRKGAIAACEASLRRLGTDHLDSYLLHWRGSHPLAETFAAFQTLREQGKILSWGVSNFDVGDLEEAFAVAGPGVIACNQVLYHLRERAIEHAVIPWCERHGVAVTAYSPFGQDDFPEAGSASGRALAAVGQANGASPRQVALAFLTRRPSVLAIPKASRVSHVEDNAGALSLRLSDDEIARIEAVFPRGPKPRSLPML
jgi:diketogulonate reductase-like aldo/keto reductase